MMSFIQFIHVLFGVSFLGILIASFLYITNSIQQKNMVLLQYALRISLFGDRILFFIIILQVFTGTFLVHDHHLSFSTPWIIVAYIIFSLIAVIWFLLLLIKNMNRSDSKIFSFRYQTLFYSLNILVIILFFIVIHDAVTQQTWLYRGT